MAAITICSTKWNTTSKILNANFQHHGVRKEYNEVQRKLDYTKMKIMAPVQSLHGKQIRKQRKQCQPLFWGAPKSLQMVIAAIKLKDAYSLEGKL